MFRIKLSNTFVTMLMLFPILYAFLTLNFKISMSVNMFISQIFCLIIPFIIYLVATRQKITNVLEIKPVSLKNILYIIILSFLIQPFIMLISAITSAIVPNAAEALFTTMSEDISLGTTIVLICILPAVCEEIAIRGAAAQNLKYQGTTGAILNGLYFGLLHLNLQQFPYAFILGVTLYYMLRITGSVLAPMLSHFIINLSQTLLFSLLTASEPVSAPAENASNNLIAYIPMIIFVWLTFWTFIQVFKRFAQTNCFINIRPAEADKILDKSFLTMLAVYISLMLLIYAPTLFS